MRAAGNKHQRDAARRCVRGADEIERAADRADVAAVGDLAVDLAGQVDLDRRVDGDEARLLRQHLGAVRVLGAAQPHALVVAREVEQLPGADQHRAVDAAHHAALRELDHAVADAAGMHAQAFVAAEQRCTRRRAGRRCRIPAPRHPERTGAALRAMARSSSPGWPRARHRRAAASSPPPGRSRPLVSSALGVRPGHLVVHLGDDRAADVERGHQVVGGEPEAVFAARVGRADLDHHHIAADLPAADQRCRAASRARAGSRARRHRRARGWCRCRSRRTSRRWSACSGLTMPGVARAEEASHCRRGCARWDTSASTSVCGSAHACPHRIPSPGRTTLAEIHHRRRLWPTTKRST